MPFSTQNRQERLANSVLQACMYTQAPPDVSAQLQPKIPNCISHDSATYRKIIATEQVYHGKQSFISVIFSLSRQKQHHIHHAGFEYDPVPCKWPFYTNHHPLTESHVVCCMQQVHMGMWVSGLGQPLPWYSRTQLCLTSTMYIRQNMTSLGPDTLDTEGLQVQRMSNGSPITRRQYKCVIISSWLLGTPRRLSTRNVWRKQWSKNVGYVTFHLHAGKFTLQ